MDQSKAEPSALLDRLRVTLTATAPFCSGTLQLSRAELELYYIEVRIIGGVRNRNVDQHIADMDELERACTAASFGKGEENVLDETYRKAGKMSPDDFVTRFNVERSGLLSFPQGAFFKPHLDTPRSDKMFGNLVVVFPTPHDGGELVLRHDGKERSFNSAQMLSGHNDCIAFVAFFSVDSQPKVIPPLESHAVTQPAQYNVSIVKDALADFLGNLDILPAGGTIAHGLRHAYPVPKFVDPDSVGDVWNRLGRDSPGSQYDLLHSVKEGLKGSDAACELLGLKSPRNATSPTCVLAPPQRLDRESKPLANRILRE
ncbi:hypothetical protein BN946_scf185041.g12 [Trametes cinnabarina]|uniref:Prolyl 4-hydroxylase alpha subunit Fe(2+) 2OG dioxygenase domain-containing protein n=1 Tax=Pycnoporus cinnabarinus TaxID=5643 RepID=A0A060STS3_PYCCI|nr:hypothetical protein BN946_scf185041.g12 [Trametes cinnabarina]